MKLRHFSALALSLVACGAPDDDPHPLPVGQSHPQPKPALVCSGIKPGPSPIRRLIRSEYNNTIRDLLGDTTRPADGFVREEEQGGFNNNAEALGVTPILAEQYMRASEGIAQRATEHLDTLLPCSVTGTDEAECVRGFIQTFGEKAYRSPVEDDEVSQLYAVFVAGRVEDFRTGIELLLQTMLQSSRFLYRVEFGTGAQPVVPLTSWEMASRLSYLFWNSMPDDELRLSAKADELRSKAQILAQATRLLADPRTHQAVANFHGQWLGLDGLDSITKSAAVYPAWSEDVRTAMRTETEMFLDDVMWNGPADLPTLLSAPYTFVNPPLAIFYGMKAPSGDAFQRVELDPQQRSGLLTQGSLLSINAHSNQTSPVTRGKFIRQRLFCQDPPPPPPSVMAVAPDLDPSLTTRQRFAAHATQASCAACHQLMDPIGLGFENYDGVGGYRTLENGLPVDASGSLFQTDVDGPFNGVPALIDKLKESQEVRDCMVTEWFRFGYGRSETNDDACSLRSLEDQFDASGSNIKALLLALSQTDAFLYRPAVVPTGDLP
jgi:Protein of unknown function (DUF1592)/Protein of unknown function (DUF1588)/Protein of unknown function (DUF1587)/Protein of unknown function (DUF1595)/Protein of unknown function (DUF1585)